MKQDNNKKIAIMQPYFFPYIGYWQLINTVDEFIIFDDVNYIKRFSRETGAPRPTNSEYIARIADKIRMDATTGEKHVTERNRTLL